MKALLCYIRLLIMLIVRVAINSDLIIKVLLFVYMYACNSLGLACIQILCLFHYICSASTVWCPKLYNPSIRCYNLLCWNKMPILQGNDKVVHTHQYANTIVFSFLKIY